MGDKKKAGELTRFLQVLGPGLITGAADDDPSGLVTFSQIMPGFTNGWLLNALGAAAMLIVTGISLRLAISWVLSVL